MRTITYRSVRREHVLKKHKGLSKTEIQIVRSATCSVFGLSIDAAGRKRADRPRPFLMLEQEDRYLDFGASPSVIDAINSACEFTPAFRKIAPS